MRSDALQMLLISLPTLLIAMVFHEYAHGWVARYWGDRTAEQQGRLTLNPIPHIDPLQTIIIPVLIYIMIPGMFFGGAKPVPIDPRRFRHYKKGLFWVSIAGVSMNLILAFLAAFARVAFYIYLPASFYLTHPLTLMAESAIIINCWLAIFNLVPIPPLDGSRILESIMPLKYLPQFEEVTGFLSRHFMLILIAFMFLPNSPLNYLSVLVRALSGLFIEVAQLAFFKAGVL